MTEERKKSLRSSKFLTTSSANLEVKNEKEESEDWKPCWETPGGGDAFSLPLVSGSSVPLNPGKTKKKKTIKK